MRRTATVMLTVALALGALPAAAEDFHIINGSPAAAGEFPAMAALLLAEPQFQFCGGTLIDPSWVVTAAHCFYDSRTGQSNVAPEQLELVVNSTNYTREGERLAVDQIVLHPDYDEFATVNDIALLHLAVPSTTPPHVVVGAGQAALYDAGRIATVAGYGTTRPDGTEPSEDLLKVDVPLVADTTCSQHYQIVADRHACAGDPGPDEANPGPDTCQGDSGGPMFTNDGNGQSVLIGITSFGGLCGVQAPGVYTEMITYLGWLGGVMGGTIQPGEPTDPTIDQLPDDASVPPVRIVAPGTTVSDPVAQAVQISSQTFFEGESNYGVVATATRFPDALGGSALAYGIAPLLFTDPDGTLGQKAIQEFQRVVRRGSPIYVLGGTGAIPAQVDEQIRLLGMQPVRLAGPGREATAARIADERIRRFDNTVPYDTMIVATAGNWPDAVTMGQVGSYWGTPILLTNPDTLHPETAASLRTHAPATVLVAGGRAAISDEVLRLIEQITGDGTAVRLGGSSRFGTARAITEFNLRELYAAYPPRFIVAVNLRRDQDAFAHVLAATMLTGRHGAVLAPVEGDGGVTVPVDVIESICGLDLPILVAGGTDLISDAAATGLQQASGGAGCDATETIDVGELFRSSITASLPTREYTFAGTAGQAVRIRMDSTGFGPEFLDPLVMLLGPDGQPIAENDDTREGGLNSLLELALPENGLYTIVAGSYENTTGPFVLSLDPAPEFEDVGRIVSGNPLAVTLQSPPAGTRLIVEMRRDIRETLDPVVVVLDAAGNQLVADNNGGGFPNARASFVAPGGDIDVVLFGADNSAGRFSVALLQP